MSDAFQFMDSLQVVNTGASVTEEPQKDPSISLGGLISSTPVRVLDYKIGFLEHNVSITFVSGANGAGEGTLSVNGSYATWKAPGGATGVPVLMVTGVEEILNDGDDSSKYIRVKRQGDEQIDITCSVLLSHEEYNAVSLTDADENVALAGGFRYRALGLQNSSSNPLSDIKIYAPPLSAPVNTDGKYLPASGGGSIWINSYYGKFPYSGHFAIYNSVGDVKEIVYGIREDFGYTVRSADRGLCGTTAVAGDPSDFIAPVYGVELALVEPVAGAIPLSPDEDTAPAGVSFAGAFALGDALEVPLLPVGDWIGLYIKQDVRPESLCIATIIASLQVYFTEGVDTWGLELSGIYRIANEVLWELYVSDTPDVDWNRVPDDSGNTLPITTPLAVPGSGINTYWYIVKFRNRFGLMSLNQYIRKIGVGSTGGEGVMPPSSPYGTWVEDAYRGSITVRSSYDKAGDEDSAGNRWAIWVGVGVDPDPDVDVPTNVRGIPDGNGAGEDLILRLGTGEYTESSDLRIMTRVYRTSDDVTDGNTDVIQFTTASTAIPPTEDIIIK